MDLSDKTKLVIDWIAVGTGIAAWFAWVPTVAGLFSIVWLATQLYDYWIKKKDK